MEAERGRREPTVFFDGMKVVLLGWMDLMIGGGGVKRCREGEEGDEQKAGWDSPNVEAKPHCGDLAGLTSALDALFRESRVSVVSRNVVPMLMIPKTCFRCNITLVPT